MKKYFKESIFIFSLFILFITFFGTASAALIWDCKDGSSDPKWTESNKSACEYYCTNQAEGKDGESMLCHKGIKSGDTDNYRCCNQYVPCKEKAGGMAICSNDCNGLSQDGNCTNDVDGKGGKCCYAQSLTTTTTKATTTTTANPCGASCYKYNAAVDICIDNCGTGKECTASGCKPSSTTTTTIASGLKECYRCSPTYAYTNEKWKQNSGLACDIKNKTGTSLDIEYGIKCSCGKKSGQANFVQANGTNYTTLCETTTTTANGSTGTTSGGGGTAAASCTTKCSDTYNHTRVTFQGSNCSTKKYSLDCTCPAAFAKSAKDADSTITNEWSCGCGDWTPIANSSGNFCCGYPQNNGSKTCTPQDPAKYSKSTNDSCFNFNDGNSSKPAQCLENTNSGSSWCCYEADTQPYTGTYKRCSDLYRFCYAYWDTTAAGLDTPKTQYKVDCQCDSDKIPLTAKCGDTSSCTASTTTTTLPPVCNNPCSSTIPCPQGIGCNTCTNGVCVPDVTTTTGPGGSSSTTTNPGSGSTSTSTIPGSSSTTTTTIPPACGTTCKTPADCNAAKDGCTTCTNNKCTKPFSEASCKCNGISTTAFISGQKATVTSLSMVSGEDVNMAKVVGETFHLYTVDGTTGTRVLESKEIAASVVSTASDIVRYKTVWEIDLPQLESGKTYRLWSNINCQPKTSAMNSNGLSKIAVLGAEIKATFWENVLSLFTNLAKNTVDSLTGGNKVAEKTIQLGTIKPATITGSEDNYCSTIIFTQE